MMEQYWALKNFSLSWRLCSLLLELADQCGVDYDGKVMLTRSLSQQEMASLLQSSRVSVARVMKGLKDLNLVEYVNGFYCIRSIAQLRRAVQQLFHPLPGGQPAGDILEEGHDLGLEQIHRHLGHHKQGGEDGAEQVAFDVVPHIK